jgi:uncharacterized protein
VETHRDAYRTSGHFLFRPGSFSSFHKVKNNEELWLIHVGRILVHVLTPHGEHRVLRLGLDFAAGERPVVTAPLGYWQAAEIPDGVSLAFGTNVCAPGFEYDQFKIAPRELLLKEYPDHEALIMRLTRESGSS